MTEAGKLGSLIQRVLILADQQLIIADNGIAVEFRRYINRLLSSDTEFLFPNRHGEQLTPDNFRKDYFYDCLDLLGIQKRPEPGETPKYTPYSCRHTFFTMMGRVPGQDKIKADLGGHTSYEVSKHYQHPDLEDKRAIINALSF